MSTTSKGNRAEQELCRKLREFGFKVTKARLSKGEWDRVASPGDSLRLGIWMALEHDLYTQDWKTGRWRCFTTTAAWDESPWYFDITTNSTRGRVKALLEKDTPRPGVKALAVRYDGKSGKPARWRFWIAG